MILSILYHINVFVPLLSFFDWGKKSEIMIFSLFLTQRVNNNILIFLLIFLLFIIIIRFCIYIYIYSNWQLEFLEFEIFLIFFIQISNNINIFYQLNNNNQWIVGLMKLPLLCWTNFRDSISNIFTWQK